MLVGVCTVDEPPEEEFPEELPEELFEEEPSEEGLLGEEGVLDEEGVPDELASEEVELLSFLEEEGLELPEELLLSEELSVFDEGVSFSEEPSEGVELVLSEEESPCEPLPSVLLISSEPSSTEEPPMGALGFSEGPPQLRLKAITAPISKRANKAAAIKSHRLSVFLSASTACFSSKEVIQ